MRQSWGERWKGREWKERVGTVSVLFLVVERVGAGGGQLRKERMEWENLLRKGEGNFKEKFERKSKRLLI